MPVRISEILHKTTEKGTLGGDTYWIEHPNWQGEERALCFRKVSRKNMGTGSGLLNHRSFKGCGGSNPLLTARANERKNL